MTLNWFSKILFVLYNKETKETLTPYIDPTDFYSQSFTVNKYIRHPKKYFYSLHETGGQYFYLGGIDSKDDSGLLSCEVDLFHLADPFDLGPYNYVYWLPVLQFLIDAPFRFLTTPLPTS